MSLRHSICLLLGLSLFSACSSAPMDVKTQKYAQLKSSHIFEYEFPVVWKAIEESLRHSKVLERSPADVNPVEMRKLTHRTLKTDWAYSQSRDKYHEYKVNESPRKIYLQTRLRYEIEASRSIAGTEVKVQTTEEIEKLKEDGTSDGFDESDSPDSSRASEILDKIDRAILSAAP